MSKLHWSSPARAVCSLWTAEAHFAEQLVGGSIAASAARNGWAGVVVYGSVRDRVELKKEAGGIYALALVPMPKLRRGEGRAGVALDICGLTVRPGQWLYADEDGIVVNGVPLHL